MPNNWQTVVVLGQLWWGFSIQMCVALGWLIGIGLCPVSRSPVSMGLLLVCFQSPLSLTIGLHSGFPFCIFQFWKPWYKFNSTLFSFMFQYFTVLHEKSEKQNACGRKVMSTKCLRHSWVKWHRKGQPKPALPICQKAKGEILGGTQTS